MNRRPGVPSCAEPILFAALAAGALVACSDSVPLSTAFEVRDSAGVEVVWNGGIGVWGPEPVDSLVEEMRIGVAEGDERYLLDRVAHAAADATGNVYVANEGSYSVRVYDRAGTFIRDIGRKGEGPGEFPRGLHRLWIEDDTLVVMDNSGWVRLSVFTTSGAFIDAFDRRQDVQRSTWPVAGRPGRWVGLVIDQEELIRSMTEAEGVAYADLGTFDYDGVLEARGVVQVPLSAVGGGLPLFGTPPFGRDPYAADGDRIVVHHGSPYAYFGYDLGGRLRRVVRRAWVPRPVPPGTADRFVALARGEVENGPAVPVWDPNLGAAAAERAALPQGDTLAPLGDVLLGRDGSTWLSRYDLADDIAVAELRAWLGSNLDDTPDPVRTWDVFDAAGRFLGAVRIPEGFVPWIVGLDEVTGLLRDELGVEHLVRYRVLPPPAP